MLKYVKLTKNLLLYPICNESLDENYSPEMFHATFTLPQNTGMALPPHICRSFYACVFSLLQPFPASTVLMEGNQRWLS